MPRFLLPTKKKAGIAGKKLGDLSGDEQQAVEARASVPFVPFGSPSDYDYFKSQTLPRVARRAFGQNRKRKRSLFTEIDDFCLEGNGDKDTMSPQTQCTASSSINTIRRHTADKFSHNCTSTNTTPLVVDHSSPPRATIDPTHATRNESKAAVAATVTPMQEEEQRIKRSSRIDTKADVDDKDDHASLHDVSQPIFHIPACDGNDSSEEDCNRSLVCRPKTMKEILSFLQKHHGPPRIFNSSTM